MYQEKVLIDLSRFGILSQEEMELVNGRYALRLEQCNVTINSLTQGQLEADTVPLPGCAEDQPLSRLIGFKRKNSA